MLSATLAHKPELWEDARYTGVRFQLFPLETDSQEYKTIQEHFPHKDIVKIERIQHPFAYGRYLLKRDQMKVGGHSSAYEKVVFHEVHPDDKNVAIEYNCDSRRYTSSAGTEPVFVSSPSGLLKMCIMLKSLQNTPQKSDANYYPTYVIEFA